MELTRGRGLDLFLHVARAVLTRVTISPNISARRLGLMDRSPIPPCSGHGPERRRTWLRLRLWQVEVVALVVLAAGWFVSLGPIPAILALLTAKHVLVAVLIAGLDLERRPRPADGGP